MKNENGTGDLRRLTALSLLSALVAVLSCLGNFIKLGPFPITLTLCPIIIGAALYGPSAGALLGGVFGVVTLITGILGWDGGAVMMLINANAVALLILCLGKAVAAGWTAGTVYRLLSRKGREKAAVVAAGILCPLTNTGIFILFMLTVYRETLAVWAGGSNALMYVFTGLAGINFLVELAVNMILSSAITMIIQYAVRRRR